MKPFLPVFVDKQLVLRSRLPSCAAAAIASVLLWAITLYAWPARAQLAGDHPDWKEQQVPAPPTFDLARLIPFEVNINAALRYGLDPQTVSIGDDGVVRYVVVAQSSTGVVTALYEGVRCAGAQVKTYARHNPSSGWVTASTQEWKLLFDNAPSRHALRLARQGLCDGATAPKDVASIVRALQFGPLRD